MTARYSVVDRETGRVIAALLTLREAVTKRDHLLTQGDPVIVPTTTKEA